MFHLVPVNITSTEKKSKPSEAHIDLKFLQDEQRKTRDFTYYANEGKRDNTPPRPFKNIYQQILETQNDYARQYSILQKKQKLREIERKLWRDFHYEATGEYIDPYQKPYKTAQQREQAVLDYQHSHILRHPRKPGIREIRPASIWTPDGRKRITRKIERRIKRMQRRLGLDRSYMITLTYAREEDYRNKDISRFMNSLLYPLKKAHIPYAYFRIAEFQKRGVIHYHIVIIVKRSQSTLYWNAFSKKRIDKLWRKGFTKIKAKNDGLKPALSYAVKYMTKEFITKDDKGHIKTDYGYLEMVNKWKHDHGNFRLYSMSIVRRFKRGVRKYLNQQYINTPPRMYEHPEMLISFIGGMYNGKWLTHIFHEESTEEGDDHIYEIPVKTDTWIAEHAPWLFGWYEKRTYNIERIRDGFLPEPEETDTDLQGEIDIKATWWSFVNELKGITDKTTEKLMELINF